MCCLTAVWQRKSITIKSAARIIDIDHVGRIEAHSENRTIHDSFRAGTNVQCILAGTSAGNENVQVIAVVLIATGDKQVEISTGNLGINGIQLRTGCVTTTRAVAKAGVDGLDV